MTMVGNLYFSLKTATTKSFRTMIYCPFVVVTYLPKLQKYKCKNDVVAIETLAQF